MNNNQRVVNLCTAYPSIKIDNINNLEIVKAVSLDALDFMNNPSLTLMVRDISGNEIKRWSLSTFITIDSKNATVVDIHGALFKVENGLIISIEHKDEDFAFNVNLLCEVN